jgi:hypothetical protein
MKKLFTVVCTMLLGASLSFAQASQGGDTTKTTTTTTTTKHKHAHAKKAAKKATKKSNSGATTATPK